MDATTALTDDEKWLFLKIMQRATPPDDPGDDESLAGEDELDRSLDEREEPGPERDFQKSFEFLATDFHRLATMEDRARFMAEAKWACSFFPIRRSTWEEAQKCIRLYGKLLAIFGWVDEGFPSALERVCMTAGNEDGKLTVLFACITGLPFGVARTPCPDQARVAAHMDASLFGLGRVKREIKNHLILAAHAQGAPAPQPLLLVGPPGTGKTAVARVVASALRLPLFKASLACAVDTIFFRGSHYGWTASAPGFLSKSLMAAGCENPVILLDEIDKAGGHGHGDVVDTLAEIFDPTQSHCFHDLFLTEVPIDLSRVTWIATANDLARVPAYIADRCRIIQIPQYREGERRVIIERYLPEQIRTELRLGFPVVVAEAVARELARATESLREAKGALTELIARELADKTPGSVERLVLATWDLSVLRAREESQPKPIGFMVPQT